MTVGETDVVAVWFSCGAASAVAAKIAVERYGERCRIVNSPVAEEDDDNRRFLRDVAKWIGKDIEIATNANASSNSAVDVWEDKKYMSGNAGAPCTNALKKEPRRQWELNNHCDWLVLGFTADESHRAERFRKNERSNLIAVLIEEGYTKRDCFIRVPEAGISLPHVYALGYPNANCIGCVKASSPTYWNHVRKCHPSVFAERAEQSRRLGARLVRVNGKRMFLDELPEHAVGQSMKTMNFECGLFCEERDNLAAQLDHSND